MKRLLSDSLSSSIRGGISSEVTAGADTTASTFLDGQVSSTVFELDATKIGSYSGSGTTWSNLTPSPADGSAKSAYDFFLGDGVTSGLYPTFNGSAGDAAAYWSFASSQYFLLKSGSNTSFLDNLHKTTGGNDFWIAVAFYKVDNSWTLRGVVSTWGGSTNPGVAMRFDTSETIGLLQRGAATANVLSTSTHTGDSYPKSFLGIVSHSHSTNKSKFWIDSATGIEIAHSFSTTTGTPDLATIGSYAGGTTPLSSETRIYSVAAGNTYLTDVDAAKIYAYFEAAHSRDYTP